MVIMLLGTALATTATLPSGFAPGWNQLASTPPRGWRSWNAFGARVTQKTMQSAIDALSARVWTIGGKANVSLLDIGYDRAGIDEGWEGCGAGVNGTQHDAAGNPVVNTDKFPDMAGLVKYGNMRGLKMGFYENGCACGERKSLLRNIEGDVRMLHELGFDAVKLDGCGAQRNMTLYAQLMQKTGNAYMIENCHWGRCTGSDDSSCPTVDWCPFNMCVRQQAYQIDHVEPRLQPQPSLSLSLKPQPQTSARALP